MLVPCGTAEAGDFSGRTVFMKKSVRGGGNMKKVIVIGSPGAGKSTFARKLKEKTGLPLWYLDMIWHKTDKTNN